MSQQSPLLPTQKITYNSKLKISLIVLNISLSSFYFGYCIVYFGQLDIGEMKKVFSFDYQDNTSKGILNGCIPIGALVGALGSSFLIRIFSRRKCLLLLNFIALIAGALIYIPNFFSLLLFRIFQGFCVGAYSAVAPLMIKELAPTQISGTLGTYSQLNVCAGVLFGCIFKYILYKATGDDTGKDYWYLLFGVTEVTLTIQTLVLLFVFPYQTPKYLLSIGKQAQARKLVQIIYKSEYVDQIMEQKKIDLQSSQTQKNVQVQTILSQTESAPIQKNKIPIIVAIHLAALQQLSGINGIVVYGGDIASKATEGQLKQLMSTLINFQQVIGTLTAGFLLARYGRKTILQFGTFLEGVGNLLVAIGFFIKGDQDGGPGQGMILFGLFLYMIVFGVSLGPIVWLYIPQIVQPRIIPFSTATNWICASLIIIMFPILTENVLNNNPAILFLFFSAWCFASFVFNLKFVIETKDKTERVIQQQYSALKLL